MHPQCGIGIFVDGETRGSKHRAYCEKTFYDTVTVLAVKNSVTFTREN